MNDGFPLQDGEQVLLIDQRGKRHLIFLRKSETFHSDRGWVADRFGLPAALWISAATPLAAFVAARFLPAPRALDTR